jgi:hypothetical protein
MITSVPGRDDDDINTDYAESDVMMGNDARNSNHSSGDSNNGGQQQQKTAFRDY